MLQLNRQALVSVESAGFYQKSNRLPCHEQRLAKASWWAQLWLTGISKSRLQQEISSRAGSCAPAVMEHKGLSQKTAETEPDPHSQLLSLLQNIEVFFGSSRLHQIGMFSKLWLGEAFTSPRSSSLLCAFLWASVWGQLEAWVRRGRESINSKRAVVYYHLFSQQASTRHLFTAVFFSVAGGTWWVVTSVTFLVSPVPWVRLWEHPGYEHQGGVFLGRSTIHKRDVFKTFFWG